MDSLKIHDSQFIDGERSSIINEFLDSKIQNVSLSTEENSKSNHRPKHYRRQTLPEYSFSITNYHIGESVEYDIVLLESFKVFRKTITEKYKFKTRYSKLQMLNQKIGGKAFPSKKLFGNKNKDFVQKRKKELECYLNGLCSGMHPQFLSFIAQIKNSSLEACYRTPFRLPN